MLTGAVVIAAIAAGVIAGVGDEMWRGARLALPIGHPHRDPEPALRLLAGSDAARSAATRSSATASATSRSRRCCTAPVSGLRFGALVLVFSLYSAVVDPDEVLQLLRRFSYRSALTASLTTRLVPVLARDASRMSDAARCRPRAADPDAARARRSARQRSTGPSTSPPRSRCAATRTPGAAPRVRKPWSRHDIRVMTSARADRRAA